MSDPYVENHVTYDQFEMPALLHCIKCHTVIARRSDSPSQRDPTVAVHAIEHGTNYREIQTILSDGSACYLPFCSGCIHDPIDPEKAFNVVKNTWEASLVHAGRPQEAIDYMRQHTHGLHIAKVGGKPIAR